MIAGVKSWPRSRPHGSVATVPAVKNPQNFG
jgi:hypothetical protein